MPSEKILEIKKQQVADLTEKLKSSVTGTIVKYEGISVADDTKLRKELREAGVDYFVVKNTLLSLASEGADLGDIKSVLEGTTAIALSATDYTAAAKILCAYAEKHDNFEIKIGFVDGGVINAGQVKELAKLPSREELVARALGGLNAPITGLVYVLDANITGLARVLGAIAEKQGA